MKTEVILAFSIPTWIHFISLCFSIALARTFSVTLSTSAKSTLPYLLPNLRGKAFCHSPLNMVFAMAFSYMSCIFLI